MPTIMGRRASATAVSEKMYAVVAGISEYDDPALASLEAPAQDQARIRDILTDPVGCGLLPVHVSNVANAS
jgi:hypothetical protein